MQEEIIETLVSFKVAELAKKKGFDEVCSYLYENSKDIVYTTHKNSGLNKHFDWYSAPRQSLLQKWLDITHNKYVHVEKHTRNGLKCYSPFINNIPVKETFFNDYDKSEEALEEALFQALKLLPDEN